MILWILYFKSWGFGFKARGLQGHVSSATYFSNLLEDKNRRVKTKLTLSLILRFNLRLGGYSIGSASSIAPYIKEDLTNYSGHEHLTASMQSRKYSEDTFKMEFGRNSKMPSEVLGRLQYSTMKSSGACQIRAYRTAHMAYIL
jgi:hypothetical protein